MLTRFDFISLVVYNYFSFSRVYTYVELKLCIISYLTNQGLGVCVGTVVKLVKP